MGVDRQLHTSKQRQPVGDNSCTLGALRSMSCTEISHHSGSFLADALPHSRLQTRVVPEPLLEHAARWWPKESRGRPHRHQRDERRRQRRLQFDGAAEKSVRQWSALQPDQSLLMFRQNGHDASELEFCSRGCFMLPPIPCSSGFEVWVPFRRTGTWTKASRKVVMCQNKLVPSLEPSPLLVPISLRRILPRWGVSH